MKFLTSLASFTALVWSVAAAPNPDGWQGWNDGCYSRSYIEGLVAQEIVYLQHLDLAAANAAALAIFDPSIAEFGDSINSLRGDPVSRQTYLS